MLYYLSGDRVLTDVVFANQNRMLSVLVQPISFIRDHPIAVILRCVCAKSAYYSLSETTYTSTIRGMERWILLPIVKLLVSIK